MNKTYRETCKQEQNIQKGLAGNWGYNITNVTLDLKQKKQKQSQNFVLANLTLRKFSKQIQKTDKIKQVQNEILALKNEKMLRQMQQNKHQEMNSQQKSEIIVLMQKIVDNYNEIVEHKHITHGHNNKQIMQGLYNNFKIIQNKNSAQIIQNINKTKKKLDKADLKQQIKINKELTQLYRAFKQHQTQRSKEIHRQKKIVNYSQIKQPTITSKIHKINSQIWKIQDNNSISQMKKSQLVQVPFNDTISLQMARKQSAIQTYLPASNEMLERGKDLQSNKRGTHYRRYSSVISKAQSKKTSQHQNKSKNIYINDIEKDLNEPYIQNKQIQQYKKIQTKIKLNNQSMYQWRNRIDEISNYSFINQQRKNIEKLKQLQRLKQDNELILRSNEIEIAIEKQLNLQKYQDNQDNKNNLYKSQFLKKKKSIQDQKQKIFASILKKRHSKFNKLWGTKILVKYNSQQEATMMLKGEPEKNPSKNTGRNTSAESKRTSSQRQTSRKHLGQSLTERRDVNKGSGENQFDWRQQQRDEQHYQRMCKNQKINLLFKRR